MTRSHLAGLALVAVAVFLSGCADAVNAASEIEGVQIPRDSVPSAALTTPPAERESLFVSSSGIEITLAAAHHTTSWDDREPNRPSFNLPVLYLHHERDGMLEADRTIEINIQGLPAGAEITLELVSRHADSSTTRRSTQTKRFQSARQCTNIDPCTVRWTFDPESTHSDFYTLTVKDDSGAVLWSNPHSDRPDLVMLDTWDVGIGAYTVRVIYATLFPFAMGQHDLGNRLAPGAVTDFIESKFVPLIRDTWQTQFNAWGFGNPIHPDWDPDNMVEIIVTDPPFALFEGTGTYTVMSYQNDQPYPQRRVWWFGSNNAFRSYDSLENAYRAVFAHEFFHLVQWNAILSAGCSTHKWRNVFIEAQGKFAPSVQHPQTELVRQSVVNVGSEYLDAANRYLSKRLNSSFRDLEADDKHMYDAALFWRFLYEQFDDPAVTNAALQEMACRYDPDIVAGLPEVMDRTFQRFNGPFHSFEESLTAFARANYALRLENGRCSDSGLRACGGFYYDPEHNYIDPSLEAELVYDGVPLTHGAAIPFSFGMDFIEVRLDPALQGQSVTLRFEGEGPDVRFNIQIWRLEPGEKKPRALAAETEIAQRSADGSYAYTISQVETTAYDRLALIVTRLDSGETTDADGKYRITVDSVMDLDLGS